MSYNTTILKKLKIIEIKNILNVFSVSTNEQART